MNRWKQYKTKIKSEFDKHKTVPVYELDYSHTFFKVNSNTVYDMQDKVFYCPQTGNI